ncbi:hypothetical protein FGB62_20g08 [Gracilaria domingensis]|nr:hypothetical protein FGB62_20g08 [Gracilaria domingensis]
MARPCGGAKERKALWKAFLIDRGSSELLRAIAQVWCSACSEKEHVELLENGFYAVLPVARFNGTVGGSLIDCDCLENVHSSLTELFGGKGGGRGGGRGGDGDGRPAPPRGLAWRARAARRWARRTGAGGVEHAAGHDAFRRCARAGRGGGRLRLRVPARAQRAARA